MSAIILFRSLTYAQRGMRVLGAGGVPATIVKAPPGLSDKGCTYGASVNSGKLDLAVRILEERQIPHGRIFLPGEDGKYRQVQI